MGADIKKLRNRIKSVDSTLHLTKAMGLVASSKMRRANEGMMRAREYGAAVHKAIAPLLGSADCRQSRYMNPSEQGKSCLVVIAGDRGLAGGYNANVFRAISGLIDGTDVIPIGKRACDRFKQEPTYVENFDYHSARDLAETLCKDFCDGKYSEISVVYTKYISMISQEACIMRLLPLSAEEETAPSDMVFEPDELTVLNSAVPEYVAGKLFSVIRESFASEIAARRCAMDSAGKNAQEMIDGLQLQYNRARQGAITQEITEIVAGSGS